MTMSGPLDMVVWIFGSVVNAIQQCELLKFSPSKLLQVIVVYITRVFNI